jgi:hypothetical protein
VIEGELHQMQFPTKANTINSNFFQHFNLKDCLEVSLKEKPTFKLLKIEQTDFGLKE